MQKKTKVQTKQNKIKSKGEIRQNKGTTTQVTKWKEGGRREMRGLSQGRGRKRGFNNVQRGIVYLKAEYAQWLPAGGTHLEHGQTQLPPPGRITAYPGSIDGFISLLCLLLSLSMSFSCSLSHHLSLLSFACFTTCYLCCCHPPDSAD